MGFPHGYNACPSCGEKKARHAAFCRRCSPLIRGQNHYGWKGDLTSKPGKRGRAENALLPVGALCSCGALAVDRHHKDNDPGNNSPANIEWLCRRCHMERDGRLQALRLRNTAGKKEPQPCVNCGRTVKHRRHGRCDACRTYFARNGRERPTELETKIKNQRSRATSQAPQDNPERMLPLWENRTAFSPSHQQTSQG